MVDVTYKISDVDYNFASHDSPLLVLRLTDLQLRERNDSQVLLNQLPPNDFISLYLTKSSFRKLTGLNWNGSPKIDDLKEKLVGKVGKMSLDQISLG